MPRASLWAEALSSAAPLAGLRLGAFGMSLSPPEPALAEAAAAGCAVTWFDWRHVSAETALGLPGRHWPWDGCTEALPLGGCDLALVGLGALHGRASFETAVRGAVTVVAPGGAVLVGGGHADGLGGARHRLQAWFGEVTPVSYRKGETVLRCLRGREVALPPPAPPVWEEATFAGARIRWRRAEGTFAGGAPDPGGELLAEAACRLLPSAPSRCCDLACGSGLVGMALLLRGKARRCTFVDNDLRSLAALRANLAANGLTDRAEVRAADIVAQPPGEWGGPFDAVLCNPPFHAGAREDRGLAQAIAAAAREAAAPLGWCLLVGVGGLRYDAAVPGAAEVAADAGYRVLAARMDRPARPAGRGADVRREPERRRSGRGRR